MVDQATAGRISLRMSLTAVPGMLHSRARPSIDSPLEGTGFEPSVPLGRIGAFNSAWIAFGRRLGLRIEHAISIDG
jgi:hypothetical protein